MNRVEIAEIAGGVRELTESELTIVGGGLNWIQVVKAVLIVTAAGAIAGPNAAAMVANDMLAGRM